jgi:hypothetical protein
MLAGEGKSAQKELVLRERGRIGAAVAARADDQPGENDESPQHIAHGVLGVVHGI